MNADDLKLQKSMQICKEFEDYYNNKGFFPRIERADGIHISDIYADLNEGKCDMNYALESLDLSDSYITYFSNINGEPTCLSKFTIEIDDNGDCFLQTWIEEERFDTFIDIINSATQYLTPKKI